MVNSAPLKVFVAGHRGLVGSAIVDALNKQALMSKVPVIILTRTRQELDLTDASAVNAFFAKEKPDHVYLAAAKVGGIYANNTYPADFIYQNLSIQNNVIHAAKEHGVNRLLFLGSSCIYPRQCPQPMKEAYLLTGELEKTNRAYAVAKISGIEMCWSYNRQYGTQFLAVMPTNLYGVNDNYHLENSHVIPAMIRKMHEAKEANAADVEIWGTGTPMREFLFNEDMADACVYLMNLPQDTYQSLLSQERPPLVNIGCGQDISIADLANLIKEIVGFKGRLVFNTDKPDGTPKKLLDVSLLSKLGWTAKTSLAAGLEQTYAAYVQNVRKNANTKASSCIGASTVENFSE